MNNSLKYIFSHAHLNIKTRKPFVCLCAGCPHFSVRWHVLREVQHGPFHWGGKRILWTQQDLLNGQEAKYLCVWDEWLILCFPQRLSRLPRGRPGCASWLFHLASLWTQLGCALGTYRAHLGHTWLTVTYSCTQLSWSGKGRTWCIDKWQSLWAVNERDMAQRQQLPRARTLGGMCLEKDFRRARVLCALENKTLKAGEPVGTASQCSRREFV